MLNFCTEHLKSSQFANSVECFVESESLRDTNIMWCLPGCRGVAAYLSESKAAPTLAPASVVLFLSLLSALIVQ